MKNELLDKGIILPSGEINKDKINLVAGAITQPFAEMVWVTTGGDMETVNRLTDILVTMNIPADREKLFKILKMLYGLWACPFRKKPSLWAQPPPFWNTSFFPLRLTWRSHTGHYRRRNRIRPAPAAFLTPCTGKQERRFFHALCYAVGVKKPLIYAAFRVHFQADKGLIPKPLKSRFYCVTNPKQRSYALWQFSELRETKAIPL